MGKEKKKILIIDDDPDIIESLKVVLEANGYDVISALEPQEGISLAKQEMPALIFLDVMMTSMDSGFDAARTIKGDPKTKDIPVVVMTALKQQTGFDFQKEAGDEDWLPADDYLEKPIKPQQILAEVKKFLKE